MKTIEELAAMPGCGLALLNMHRCAALHPECKLSAFDLLNGLRDMGLQDSGLQEVIDSVGQGGEVASALVGFLACWVQLQRRIDVERARGMPDPLLQPLVQELRNIGRRFPGVDS